MAKGKTTYREIQNSFKEIRKKLRELRESNADPEVIKFVKAHLRWIEQEVAAHKAELSSANSESESTPSAKKQTL